MRDLYSAYETIDLSSLARMKKDVIVTYKAEGTRGEIGSFIQEISVDQLYADFEILSPQK